MLTVLYFIILLVVYATWLGRASFKYVGRSFAAGHPVRATDWLGHIYLGIPGCRPVETEEQPKPKSNRKSTC